MKDLTQVFAGAHDASVISTSTGQCDAGFAQDTMVPDLLEKGQLKEGQLVQIWTSEAIPGSPLAMNTSTLDASTQETLRALFRDKANVDHLTPVPPSDAIRRWANERVRAMGAGGTMRELIDAD